MISGHTLRRDHQGAPSDVVRGIQRRVGRHQCPNAQRMAVSAREHQRRLAVAVCLVHVDLLRLLGRLLPILPR
eukprot:scaffold31845_cov30-Tisochrysis_lutea.AAC.1